MSQAIQAPDHCLLGILEPSSGSVSYYSSQSDMEQAMSEHSSAVILYNQHPDAIQFIETHPMPEGQFSLEIFQDIEGVFGLRAYQMQERMQRPVEISFFASSD